MTIAFILSEHLIYLERCGLGGLLFTVGDDVAIGDPISSGIDDVSPEMDDRESELLMDTDWASDEYNVGVLIGQGRNEKAWWVVLAFTFITYPGYVRVAW